MLRRCIFLFLLALLWTCDDGDVITVSLDFDKVLQRCDNDAQSYFVFDLKQDPSESIGVIIDISDSLVFKEPTIPGEPVERDIDGSDYRFIYRTYNRAIDDGDNGELCDLIPPSDLVIREDYEAPTGQIVITSTVEDDDQDGIPTIFEDDNTDGDNDPETNPVDTDLDGIPDYRDRDDDGDNVPTIDELNDDDVDSDPNTNPLDTDSDGIPDYLDKDDDGDEIDTRLEDETPDQDPRNDTITDADGNIIPHYLNSQITQTYDDLGPNPGSEWRDYKRIVTTNFLVRGFDLQIIRGEEYNLGDYTTETTITGN